MGHSEGAPRTQHRLFPAALDDAVAEEHPARVIDALVDRLDLDALGFRHTQPAATGRPSSAPGDLLTLYIYGAMNRLRASRRLEQDPPRTVALRWLLRKRPPDFKTLADFRKDQAPAFTQVFRAFALRCKEWGLCGQARVAIAGTKRKAVKSHRRNLTQAKRHATLKRMAAHIEHYWHDWDAADAAEAERQTTSAHQRREKIRERRARQGRDEGLRRELELSGQRQVSWTAPDSRARPKSPPVDVGDNAHVAVDDTHQLCVVPALTKAVTAVDQRRGLALQAQEALEVEPGTVVADRGDDHGEELKAGEEAGLEPDVAKPLTSAHRP
jgi:transposase